MINIAIADDHALIREGLSKILSYEKDLNIVAESSSGEDLIKKIEGIEVEIVLLDINRELRILLEISNGLKNKDIAEKLYLSEKTIKNYVTAIFKKIGVEDRVHATIFAINNGIEGYYNRRVYKKIEK